MVMFKTVLKAVVLQELAALQQAEHCCVGSLNFNLEIKRHQYLVLTVVRALESICVKRHSECVVPKLHAFRSSVGRSEQRRFLDAREGAG